MTAHETPDAETPAGQTPEQPPAGPQAVAPPAGRPGRGGRLAQWLGVLGAVALAGYAAAIVVRDPTLHPSIPWMLVWFGGALLLHDLVLFPLYAAADRALGFLPTVPVPLVNHIRAPLLGSGLTLLVYLPGIIRQGEPGHLGATGLDQAPYLARWLWLTAAMFAVSALVWVVRYQAVLRKS